MDIYIKIYTGRIYWNGLIKNINNPLYTRPNNINVNYCHCQIIPLPSLECYLVWAKTIPFLPPLQGTSFFLWQYAVCSLYGRHDWIIGIKCPQEYLQVYRWPPLFSYFLFIWSLLIVKLPIFPYTCTISITAILRWLNSSSTHATVVLFTYLIYTGIWSSAKSHVEVSQWARGRKLSW